MVLVREHVEPHARVMRGAWAGEQWRAAILQRTCSSVCMRLYTEMLRPRISFMTVWGMTTFVNAPLLPALSRKSIWCRTQLVSRTGSKVVGRQN